MPKPTEYQKWDLPIKTESTEECKYLKRILQSAEKNVSNPEEFKFDLERIIFILKNEMYSKGLSDMDRMHNAVNDLK